MKTIIKNRQSVRNILNHSDQRLLVVVGPCSIHDPKAAIDYAEKLVKTLSKCSIETNQLQHDLGESGIPLIVESNHLLYKLLLCFCRSIPTKFFH